MDNPTFWWEGDWLHCSIPTMPRRLGKVQQLVRIRRSGDQIGKSTYYHFAGMVPDHKGLPVAYTIDHIEVDNLKKQLLEVCQESFSKPKPATKDDQFDTFMTWMQHG